MQPRTVAALVAVLALLGAAPASAQEPSPRGGDVVLTGTVVDEATGAPIPAASVTFQRADRTVFTDERGAFSAHLPDGPETMIVEQLGYHRAQVAVVVNSGMPPGRVRLAPDPVQIKGIAVINRRLGSSSLAIAMSVRTFTDKDLARGNSFSVGQYLNSRGAFTPYPCPFGAWSTQCIWSRGQVVEPRVFMDDHRLYGGLDELSTMSLQDVYRVDVYQRGLYIHVVTRWWMEHAVRHGYTTFIPFY